MNPDEPIVFALDDDASMREGLSRLFRSIGMRAQIFALAEDFLIFKRPDVPACVVLDVRLPGLSGLELQLSDLVLMALIGEPLDEHGIATKHDALRL